MADSAGTGSYPPNEIISQTNLAGALVNIQDDPDLDDDLWMLGSGPVDLRVGFPLAGGSLMAGVARQKFRVLIRSFAGYPSSYTATYPQNGLQSSENTYPAVYSNVY